MSDDLPAHACVFFFVLLSRRARPDSLSVSRARRDGATACVVRGTDSVGTRRQRVERVRLPYHAHAIDARRPPRRRRDARNRTPLHTLNVSSWCFGCDM